MRCAAIWGTPSTGNRSAIFYHTEDQKKTAEALIDWLNKRGKWGAPIVTEVTKADQYWKAEDDHQDYLERLPKGNTCHFLRPESVLAEWWRFHGEIFK